jgi:hypothetical protein
MATSITITNSFNGNKISVVRCCMIETTMNSEMMYSSAEAEIDVADRLLEDFLEWVASLSLRQRAMWLVHAVQEALVESAKRRYREPCSWSVEKGRERSQHGLRVRMDDMFTIPEEEACSWSVDKERERSQQCLRVRMDDIFTIPEE